MTDYEHKLREYGLTDSQLLAVLADVHSAIARAHEERRDEIDQLCEALDMYRNGYQGACMACEPVGELNQKLDAEVRELKQQVSRFEEERDAYKRKYARLKWRGLDDE